MEHIQGATAELVKTEHLVNLKIELRGASGTHCVDYRTNKSLLASVGLRATISFKSPPVIELATVTSADVSYNIRATHYKRLAESKPGDIGDIAAIPGSVEIIRSQLQNLNRIAVGHAPNVTELIKPDPLVGHSPCLDIAWTSLGTSSSSQVVLIIHCVIEATGSDLPEY